MCVNVREDTIKNRALMLILKRKENFSFLFFIVLQDSIVIFFSIIPNLFFHVLTLILQFIVCFPLKQSMNLVDVKKSIERYFAISESWIYRKPIHFRDRPESQISPDGFEGLWFRGKVTKAINDPRNTFILFWSMLLWLVHRKIYCTFLGGDSQN